MVCCAVLSDMRLDIDHAHALAQELLHSSFTPVEAEVENSASDETVGTTDFHLAVSTALGTYADNAAVLLRTAHEMGGSAVHTLTVVADTDADLAGEFTGHLSGVRT